jgi:MYXO-CTERM domain-containing protein
VKVSILAGALLAATLPSVAMAQSITTTAPTNGSGGVFLQLTPTSSALQVNSFATYFSSAAGTPVSVEVWTRPGAYAGFTASNAGWTLSETVIGTSAGTATQSGNVILANPILVPTGGPTSIYFHAITTGGGIRYTGTAAAPPQTTWINADLTLFSDVSRTGAVAFAGTQFTPRTFSGAINYSVVPAPGAMALLGLGGLLAARRRR